MGQIKKPTLIIIIIALLIIWKTGATIDELELDYSNQKKNVEHSEKNAKYTANQKFVQKQDSIISNLNPPESKMRATGNDAMVSAYQGVEVHIEGLRWKNNWFNSKNDHNILTIEGRNDFDLNQVVFDPDLPECGKPDLYIDVSEPEIFRVNNFLEESLNYKISKVLGSKLSVERPYETYSWNVRDEKGNISKKVKMDLWLLKFSLNIRVEPAPDDERTDDVKDDTRHPVTKSKLNDEPEYDNQRYGNVSLALRFVPKGDSWFIGSVGNNGLLNPNSTPNIGVAAVECISVKFDGDPEEKDTRIGAHIFKGKSLALHNNVEDFIFKRNAKSSNYVQNVNKQTGDYYKFANSDQDVGLNSGLFDKDKFAIIHLANIGAWEKGSFFNIFSSGRKYADNIKADFVIHTFVVGEWNVKRPHLVDFEPPEQYYQEQPSLISSLIPDFGLGFLGKIFSGTGLIIVGVLVLGLFFPPVLSLINLVLRVVVSTMKNLFTKQN